MMKIIQSKSSNSILKRSKNLRKSEKGENEISLTPIGPNIKAMDGRGKGEIDNFPRPVYKGRARNVLSRL